MKKNIGKNTLGDGGKMSVQLRKFARSTHDLSYAWRNTQGVGTLVPFMHLLGLPGDTFNIDLEAEVMTHPTVGPLFGSFKLQVDVFECPIRLYQKQLHNNALNIGLKMSEIKLPKLMFPRDKDITPKAFSNSNILSYLGTRNVGKYTARSSQIWVNGTKLLAYMDIFKNYYANKQEEECFFLNPPHVTKITWRDTQYELPQLITSDGILITFNKKVNAANVKLTLISNTIPDWKQETIEVYATEAQLGVLGITITQNADNTIELRESNTEQKIIYWLVGVSSEDLTLEKYKLENIDTIRESILSTNAWTNTAIASDNYLNALFNDDGSSTEFSSTLKSELGGLFVKTHQSDLFNNWVNTEWVDGENGINAITAIDTSSGSFNLDTLNLAKKVYNMLNRIAVSGGTYNDWIETVYTNDYVQRSEIPVYIGGMSKRIEFGQVTSTAASGNEPLATLAGKGYSDAKKGGRLKFKCSEPCYIIGIVSITPYVDYYQGNSFDWHLDNMDELHKPQLDGIGWQDLTTDIINASTIRWDSSGNPLRKAIGKTIAWANYMTAVNENHGNFCSNESFMVLNREYGVNETTGDLTGSSTYIDPAAYNYIFADTSRSAMNFWLQIGCGVEARRKMSAKQIPIM